MIATAQPTTDVELCDALHTAASARQRISLTGNDSKRLLGGKPEPADVRISTSRLRRILRYEPRDLTISVEAGMPFASLQAELARHGQMIPLDGAYADIATVGGMVAANINGPRRRLYGTARDLVIGMRFATLDGRVVNTGGMVVKNVAGLDMGKILIGSYGTLAAILSVNFKLIPLPRTTRTFIFRFDDLKSASEAVASLRRDQLAPAAIELLNPLIAAQLNLPLFNQRGWTLAASFGGSQRLIDRINCEMLGWESPHVLAGDEEAKFWRVLQAVTPRFLERFSDGAVVRISTPISETCDALGFLDNAAGAAHAGSGVVRGWFTRPDPAVRFLNACVDRGWEAVIEGAGDGVRSSLTLWPKPQENLVLMKKLKQMFDPEGLLNRGRFLQVL